MGDMHTVGRFCRPLVAATRRWLVHLAGAAMLAGATPGVMAQAIPDAGNTLRQLDAPSVVLPGKAAPIPTLAAPAPAALPAAPALRFTLKGLRITGATAFSDADFQPVLQQDIGRDVGFADLTELAARLTRFYHQRGYPLASAYLPAQDIQGGVVRIQILEGRIGKVELRNRSRVNNTTVTRFLDDLPGHVVTDTLLERTLLLTYDLPGVLPVQAVLSPGAVVGETELGVELAAGRTVAGAVELDNHGSNYTGANRVSGRIEVFSPAGIGDQFSARLMQADSGLSHARIGYQMPLGVSGLAVGVEVSRASYRLGKAFAALDASGDAETWSLRASYPLLRTRNVNLTGRVGIERKDFQDRVRATAFVNDKSSRLATLAVNGDFTDAVGGGSVNAFALVWTRGDLNIATAATRAIDAASARTEGSFDKLNLSYLRLQSLSGPLSGYLSLYGQMASKNLDSSEKLILGGANGIRAYPQGEAPGDSGYLLTGELRYGLHSSVVPGRLELVGFVDLGSVKANENPFAAGSNQRNLSGGGVGLNWTAPNDVSVRFSLAQRLGSSAATAGSDSKTRGWLQLVKQF